MGRTSHGRTDCSGGGAAKRQRGTNYEGAVRPLRKLQRVKAEPAFGFGIRAPHNEAPDFEGFPGGNATLARDAARPQLENQGSDYGPWVSSSQQHYDESRASVAEDDFQDDQIDVGGEYTECSLVLFDCALSRFFVYITVNFDPLSNRSRIPRPSARCRCWISAWRWGRPCR